MSASLVDGLEVSVSVDLSKLLNNLALMSTSRALTQTSGQMFSLITVGCSPSNFVNFFGILIPFGSFLAQAERIKVMKALDIPPPSLVLDPLVIPPLSMART